MRAVYLYERVTFFLVLVVILDEAADDDVVEMLMKFEL
jgi:hypothetical protein